VNTSYSLVECLREIGEREVKHDDQVDVLSLIGRMLSDMGTASDWSKPMPYMDVAVV